jgi:hypothetical protein
MNRREAVQRLALLFGGVLSTELTAGLMGQVINTGPSIPFSPDQEILLAELADVIIPTTDTPGAKAAGVEKFIIRVMRDCYRKDEQLKFHEGLAKFESSCKEKFSKSFVQLDNTQKHEAVSLAAKNQSAFFRSMRQFTISGYFTSEIGATKALEYLPIPGKFQGDVPLKPGQKAWAI